MKQAWYSFGTVAALAAGLALLSGSALADPPVKPPCGTNGPLLLSVLSQLSYSYVQTAAGHVDVNFTVTSPPKKVTGGCDETLPPVFGNGTGGNDTDPLTLLVNVSIGKVTDVTGGGSVVVGPGPLLTAIVNAFGATPFSPGSFHLTPPVSGSQKVDFTFTNSASIPVGEYDIEINVKPEGSVGVGDPTALVFALMVTAPTELDTQAPIVTIVSPAPSARVCLNGNLSVNFTAFDPSEGGVGTGITDVGAVIDSSGGAISDDISDLLDVSPSLPVAADVLVTSTADVAVNDIGAFLLTATADDGAGHTGESTANFTVAANVYPLPPISLEGRQFKAGSTVPIKWKLTDCDGLFLALFESVKIEIYDGTGLLETRYAGDGADNIRWELDEFGNATQYITNFPVPAAGPYTVKVFVDDVDGASAEQGSFGFLGANKGGKS